MVECTHKGVGPKGDAGNELLYSYMEKNAEVSQGFSPLPGGRSPRGSKLQGNDSVAYNYLKGRIIDIAAGNLSDTGIQMPLDLFANGQTTFTRKDLGVDILSGNDVTSAAKEMVKQKYYGVDIVAVVKALVAALPYDFYWFDKAKGCKYVYNINYYNATTETLTCSGGITFNSYVSKEYSDSGKAGGLKVDTSKTEAPKKAAANAKAIVAEYNFYCGNNLVSYKYDNDTRNQYGDSKLTLAKEGYGGIPCFLPSNVGTEKIAGTKKAQTMRLRVKVKKVKAKVLKKKAVTLSVLKVKGAKGVLRYKKISGSSKLTINGKTCKVKVAKKTKKGRYTIKVRVYAAGNGRYYPCIGTAKVRIKVK